MRTHISLNCDILCFPFFQCFRQKRESLIRALSKRRKNNKNEPTQSIARYIVSRHQQIAQLTKNTIFVILFLHYSEDYIYIRFNIYRRYLTLEIGLSSAKDFYIYMRVFRNIFAQRRRRRRFNYTINTYTSFVSRSKYLDSESGYGAMEHNP